MNAQDLKNSILQLAIQGKLVEQREEEGTTKELLEQIKAVKEQLIKEKKIKKSKPLPEITEDEIPFDIPESWVWVRVGDVGSWSAGATPSRSNPEYYGGNIPWLKTGDLNDGYIDEVPEYISEKALEKTSVRLNPVGSVLMAMYGATIGKLGILNIEATTNQACCACIPYEGIYNKYLFYYLMGQRRAYIKMGAGGAQPNISKEKITASLIPLPPLEEQKRIVAKIEELKPYVDKYDVAYSEVEELNKKFPEDMQKSILQYAIQGKLVEQREEDGTAEELYQQIQEEKKKLIKEGKIKKTKALLEIAEDEILFDIPENWKWVRLGELLNKLTDGAHHTPKYTASGVPFISVKDVSGGKIEFSNTKFISQEEHEVLYKRCNPEKEDILLTKVGTTGIPVIVDTDQEFSLFVSVALLKFNTDLIYNKYLLYAIKAPVVQIQAQNNTRGVGNKNWVMRDIANTILPLPPLEEQKRIVEKVEELLPYSKQLVK
ncbi:restriction endonuclease subunit S [Bacillus altitudinis]|uniref:restriction endonuclease subunit S n=1 Tax=Bacillus altitudinis TaxID=293387 RepID=UPI0023CE5150|nr:restriction endonuclease subunit S [Bacillus altitudinis]CAI7727454.1 Type-1 restriction enzyme EcoKI specificity protein [Bacillus altitudinis]